MRGFPECDQEIQKLASKIWGECDGEKVKSRTYGKGKIIWGMPLDQVLLEMNVPRDFIAENIDNSDQHIDYIHRATEKEDIYFVSNSALTREIVRCRFRNGRGRVPSFWNPENGSVTPCHVYEVKDGFTHINLDLAPASSIFVVFSEGGAQDPIIEITSPNPTALQVTAMEGETISAKIWMPGDYSFKTANGRTGKLSIPNIPADHAINNPWKITFPKDCGAPESITMDSLVDWTQHSDPGVKYFSGSANYQNTFHLTEISKNPIILDLGTVKEVAVVRVNGKEAGTLWKEPYQIDISAFAKAGENQLEIQVTNTWNNRLVGDSSLKPEERITRTNLAHKFSPKSPLLSSGLLGPVVIKFPVLKACELK